MSEKRAPRRERRDAGRRIGGAGVGVELPPVCPAGPVVPLLGHSFRPHLDPVISESCPDIDEWN